MLPESLDDYVSDTNPVCVVDVFVDELRRNELERARLQHEARYENPWHHQLDEGVVGLKGLASLPTWLARSHTEASTPPRDAP